VRQSRIDHPNSGWTREGHRERLFFSHLNFRQITDWPQNLHGESSSPTRRYRWTQNSVDIVKTLHQEM
jgi:hypothetical protein